MLQNFVLQLVAGKKKITKEIKSASEEDALNLMAQYLYNNSEKYKLSGEYKVNVFCRETKKNSSYRMDL